MFRGLAVFLLLLAGGCAASHSTARAPVYEERAASTLVFQPPIAVGQAPVELARDDRGPAAFVGFEDLTATFFYIRMDDRQSEDGSNCLFRRAVSEKIGVSYR